VLNLETLLRDY